MTFEMEPPDEPCPDCGSTQHRACDNAPTPTPEHERDFLKDQKRWRNDPDKYEREATTPTPTPEPRRYAARYIGDTEAERVASQLNEAGTPETWDEKIKRVREEVWPGEYEAGTPETPNIDRCPKCGEYLHDEMGHMCPETPIAAENVKLRQRIEKLDHEVNNLRDKGEQLATIVWALQWRDSSGRCFFCEGIRTHQEHCSIAAALREWIAAKKQR